MKKATKSLMIIATLIITVLLMVSCNKEQTVQNYTVTYVTNGGTSVPSATTSKIESEPVTTRQGYVFGGWFANEDLSGDRIVFPYTLTKDLTLYAKWTEQPAPTYTVTFEVNGGSAVETVTVSSISEEPLTVRDGYTFYGWFDNEQCDGVRIAFPYTPTQNTKLYAKWVENSQAVKYNVTFHTNGGSAVQSIEDTQIATEPQTVREGYTFAGWFDNEALEGNRISFPYTLDKDVNLYAKWTEITYTATFVTNGGSSVAQITGKQISAEPVTEREGYSFAGWFDNEQLNGDRITFPYTLNKDATLYAKWTPVQAVQWVQTTLEDYETTEEGGVVTIGTYKGKESHIILPRIEEGTKFVRSFLWQGSEEEDFTVTHIRLPKEITSTDPYWYAYAPMLEAIEVEADNPSFTAAEGVLYNKEMSTLIAYPLKKQGETVTIPSTVTEVGSSAFNGNDVVQHLILEEGVQSIGGTCFAGMSNLKTVSLPSTLKTMGGSVFVNCPQIEELVLPSTLESCGSKVVDKRCTSLKRLIGPACMQGLGGGLPNLEYVEINGGEQMRMSLCKGITSLKTVVIANTVTAFAESVFEGCTSLTDITLSNQLTLISSSSFKGCSSLAEIEIPSSVKEVRRAAFKDCTSLKKVMLPEGLTKFEDFFEGSAIEELYIPSTISKFSTLINAVNLKTVHCPAGIITKLYSGITAFERAPIQNLIILSGGSIPSTGDYSLGSLHTLVINEGVTEIHEKAFASCYALVQITNLSGVNWSPLQHVPNTAMTYIPSPAEYRTSENVAFTGKITKEENGFVKYAYNGNVTVLDCDRSVTSLSASDFDGYTAIGNLAFDYCTSLQSVVIPSNIKTIGYEAFRWCSQLSDVTISDGVEEIGAYAFSATGLTSVTIPHSVVTIGTNAFTGDSLVINVKGYTSKPDGWANGWYSQTSAGITVNWGI